MKHVSYCRSYIKEDRNHVEYDGYKMMPKYVAIIYVISHIISVYKISGMQFCVIQGTEAKILNNRKIISWVNMTLEMNMLFYIIIEGCTLFIKTVSKQFCQHHRV